MIKDAAWNGYPQNSIMKHAFWNNGSNNAYNSNDIASIRIYIKIKHSKETADILIKQDMKNISQVF